MKWSFRIGSLFGIPIYLHFTFLLLLGGIALLQSLQGGIAAGLAGAGWVATIFACVLLHEFGHVLAARRFGIPTRDVTLLPIGGLARLERMPEKPHQELVVALAGPAVNVMLAVCAAIALFVTGAAMGGLAPSGGSFLGQLFAANVALAVFNMLPAFPMDGGRVLRALLAMPLGYVRATDIAAMVGKGMALLFGLVGIFKNPILVLIAVFVWSSGSQEAAYVRMRAVHGGFDPRGPQPPPRPTKGPGSSSTTTVWHSGAVYGPDGRPVRRFEYRIAPPSP